MRRHRSPDLRVFVKTLLADAGNRRIAVALLMLAAIAAMVLIFGRSRADQASDNRPQLLLMSSIPLQWGEVGISDIAKGNAEPSPLFDHLSEQNRVVVIDDFQKLGEPGSIPLLLIQPRALAPRELVELDGWIRKGGKVIIFADPALDWPSDLPLGDQRRPLFTSLLTPMFRHWGLELALPVGEDNGDADVMAGEYRLSPKSAGIWLKADGKPSARCEVSDDQFLATCNVGKGIAVLIADADLLHEDRWTSGLVQPGTTDWLDTKIATLRHARTEKPVP
jgi:hypothetical protein